MYKYKLKIIHFFMIYVYILIPIYVLLFSKSNEDYKNALIMLVIGLFLDFLFRNFDNKKLMDFLRKVL